MIFFLILRSLLGVLLVLPLLTLVLAPLLVLVGYFGTQGRSLQKKVQFLWAEGFLFWFGVRLRVRGKIPSTWEKEGFVVLFNHRSFVDIFTLVSVFRGINFGAKAELFKIPIFGWALKSFRVIVIDRSNRKRTIRQYEKSIERLQLGDSVALAPEGTRNNTPEPLLPFKSGPFQFALQAQTRILPVLISGADQIWPKGDLMPGITHLNPQVKVYILEPIDVVKYKLEDRHKLKESTFKIMSEATL